MCLPLQVQCTGTSTSAALCKKHRPEVSTFCHAMQMLPKTTFRCTVENGKPFSFYFELFLQQDSRDLINLFEITKKSYL